MASMEAATPTAGPELSMEASEVQQPQGVVLVILDVNKEISTHALNWALGHVARKGDALRLVGILSHVLNPSKLFFHIELWVAISTMGEFSWSILSYYVEEQSPLLLRCLPSSLGCVQPQQK